MLIRPTGNEAFLFAFIRVHSRPYWFSSNTFVQADASIRQTNRAANERENRPGFSTFLLVLVRARLRPVAGHAYPQIPNARICNVMAITGHEVRVVPVYDRTGRGKPGQAL